MLTNNQFEDKMNKLNKFTEYIGIAVNGDIIALGGAALSNCNTR